MACLGPPRAALQSLSSSSASVHAAAPRLSSSGGAASRRRAAAAARPSSGWAAGDARLSSRLQPRPAASALVPGAASGSGGSDGGGNGSSGSDGGGNGSSSTEAAGRKKGGRPFSPVPEVNAAQLLHSLGLEGAADPAALLSSLRKLRGVRQQGVLDNAAAVASHLVSPAVGLTQQQVGRLLQRCPQLFRWPPEQRAAVLFGDLMGAGLAAEQAAQCFLVFPPAARYTSFAAGLAELAAILAHSQDRDSSRGGRRPKVPAAQRTVTALLGKKPNGVRSVCNSAGNLQQRAAELQQAGFTPAEVATLAWDRPEQLASDSVARVAAKAVVLRQQLGLPAEVVSLVTRHRPAWLGSSDDTLQKRAAALAEGFGRAAAADILTANHAALNCEPGVWRRNLRYMAACGVADPAAVLRQAPELLHRDHAASIFLQRRLMLQRCFQLTAAQLYEGHPPYLRQLEPPELAQRLQFVQHRGQAHRLVAKAARGRKPRTASSEEQQPALTLVSVTGLLPGFLAAVGASEQEWEAWAAANPAAVCPVYRWAHQAAEEEQRRLVAVLPPELRQAERWQHSAAPRCAT